MCKIFVNDGDDGIDGDDDDQYGRHQCNRQQKCRSRSNFFRTRNFTWQSYDDDDGDVYGDGDDDDEHGNVDDDGDDHNWRQ